MLRCLDGEENAFIAQNTQKHGINFWKNGKILAKIEIFI